MVERVGKLLLPQYLLRNYCCTQHKATWTRHRMPSCVVLVMIKREINADYTLSHDLAMYKDAC